jgi:predicted negative regulator of RcsB-dependent stress response
MGVALVNVMEEEDANGAQEMLARASDAKKDEVLKRLASHRRSFQLPPQEEQSAALKMGRANGGK